jgi:hypothetical protein
VKKNRLNQLKFWKIWPVRFSSVRFWFYKPKTEPNRTQTGKQTEPNWKKTKPNRAKTKSNRKKPSQNRKNRVKPVWTGFCSKKPNRTEPNRKWSPLIFSNNNWLILHQHIDPLFLRNKFLSSNYKKGDPFTWLIFKAKHLRKKRKEKKHKFIS